MDEQYKMISERIRELREIFDLSEEEMAKETGVEVSAYKEYETSGKNIPISVLYHISQKFGVDLSEILTGEAARISTMQVCRRGKGQTIDRHRISVRYDRARLSEYSSRLFHIQCM